MKRFLIWIHSILHRILDEESGEMRYIELATRIHYPAHTGKYGDWVKFDGKRTINNISFNTILNTMDNPNWPNCHWSEYVPNR